MSADIVLRGPNNIGTIEWSVSGSSVRTLGAEMGMSEVETSLYLQTVLKKVIKKTGKKIANKKKQHVPS